MNLDNPKVDGLYNYIKKESNSDSEFWYGGYSDIDHLLDDFSSQDIVDESQQGKKLFSCFHIAHW